MKLTSMVLVVAANSFMCNAFTSSTYSDIRITSRSSSVSPQTKLWGVIEPDVIDEIIDDGMGGVRLVRESAILLQGNVIKSIPDATDLKRYKELTLISEEEAMEKMDKAGMFIICSGSGKELYQDPGQSTMQNIVLAPIDAASKALATSPDEKKLESAKIVQLNFVGGNQLMVNEVLKGVELLASELGFVSTKTEVTFNSLCHHSFPDTEVSVVVIGMSENTVEKNVFFHQGKWWTLLEDNIDLSVS